MFRGIADQILGRAGSGRVQTVFASDVSQLQGLVLRELRERDDIPSVVSITWEEAPGLKNELEAVVDAMAEAARSIWPRWYSSPIVRFEQREATPPELAEIISDAKHRSLPFSEAWTKRVWERCQKGKLPISKKVTAAEQVHQLALAIDPHQLVLVVTVLGAATKKGRLQTLTRAVEWMAAQAGVPLIFLAPAAWKDRSELDGINYLAIDADVLDETPLEMRAEVPIEHTSIVTNPGADESGVILTPPSSKEGEPGSLQSDLVKTATTPTPRNLVPVPTGTGVVVEPVFDKPRSEVEKHLAQFLSADAELSRLFRWNHPVQVLGPSCSVDLLWDEGRLVIEIDGSSHRTQLQYSKDRKRDYLLLLEGYTTLRLTNESVIHDVELVIEQIRKVVHHLQAKGIAKTHGTESQTGTRAVAHAHG